ncbi:hypothetical protein KIN20_027582 [Parelaphostrongylus tenuis]|uniref:Uncharacterized protein n=1 Tax=Parelaphostrongylus tenuis TaxID=148309 RepID=A0AAD5WDZ8_PARTN|nr:hypothetical protein KIN20_027582 [Parelaphostrongylus tenuis]
MPLTKATFIGDGRVQVRTVRSEDSCKDVTEKEAEGGTAASVNTSTSKCSKAVGTASHTMIPPAQDLRLLIRRFVKKWWIVESTSNEQIIHFVSRNPYVDKNFIHLDVSLINRFTLKEGRIPFVMLPDPPDSGTSLQSPQMQLGYPLTPPLVVLPGPLVETSFPNALYMPMLHYNYPASNGVSPLPSNRVDMIGNNDMPASTSCATPRDLTGSASGASLSK